MTAAAGAPYKILCNHSFCVYDPISIHEQQMTLRPEMDGLVEVLGGRRRQVFRFRTPIAEE